MPSDFSNMVAQAQLMQAPADLETGLLQVQPRQPSMIESILQALGGGFSKYTPEIGLVTGTPLGPAGGGIGLAAGTILQRLIAPEQAQARDVAFEQMPKDEKAMLMASGFMAPIKVVGPKPVIGEPALPGLWSKNQQPVTHEFQIQERMPGLAKEKSTLFKGVSQENPAMGELTAAYEGGLLTNMTDVENYFNKYLNRDPNGMTLFGNSFNRQIDVRRDLMRFPEYTVEKQSFTSGRKNIKTAQEISPFDCSRGCLGFCPECYAAIGKSTLRSHGFPREIDWVGHITKNKGKDLLRIGENGEPGFNPRTFKDYIEPEYRQWMESDRYFTPEELYNLAEPAYDWSYFNEQAKKVGLDLPKGQDRAYIISKLQGLRNFDPNIVRNLEASIDTLTPDHFFRTLKNVEQLKAMDPNYNLMLRIRSIATSNPEINALQKIAVDFANRWGIPVLETRLRFKTGEGGMIAEVLPEYIWQGSQYVHQSYYPSIYPKSQLRPQKEGNITVNRFEAHTPEGPKDTGVSLVYEGGQKSNPMTEVWLGGQGVVATKPFDEAKAFAFDLAKMHGGNLIPSKQTVWNINRSESPLSQFGLNPTLHYQCNTYNVSGPACQDCSACRAFTQLEKARAK